MTPPLFLLDYLPLVDVVLLTGDEGRHAAQVKRLRAGEQVLLSDGCGALLECVVRDVRSDGLVLNVRARHAVTRPEPSVTVVQALPKGDRAELAVEVLTELGVDRIVPWAASRSITQWRGPRADKALEKWRRTAREATKQSRRPWLPEITQLASTADVAALLATADSLVLHESAKEPLVEAALPDAGALVLVVGPEGGISDAELAEFAAAGARAVRLGDPVLRTSTAGAAALAVVSARLGRWG